MSVQEEALSQKDHTEEVKGPLHNSSSPRDKEPRAKEWEKVQKWQEARIERRLRGEYESAVLHLQEVVSDSDSSGFTARS
jgi:outer membrane protein insertion porin family